MPRFLTWSTNAFPLWAVALSALALVQPAWFTWFSGPWIVWGLAIIMLGMGLTLTFEDFRAVGHMPKAVALGLVQRVQLGLPLVSVVVIALICASIIGSSSAAIQGAAPRLLGAVAGLHLGGFALGSVVARLAGIDRTAARTVSIEVGMQNSGLGVVLARRHFTDPLTAVPCAISSVFHSVIGSTLAGWWRWCDRPRD